VINAEEKTEEEITELSKKYTELVGADKSG